MGNRKVQLKLDWCSYEAAEFAVMRWHYSRRMPASKLAKIGVWEDGRFIGAVIYGTGASRPLVQAYGLTSYEGCELVRVALDKHQSHTSRIVAISIRMIKRQYPGLRLIVSFADPEQGHVGGLYQAGGWIYAGRSAGTTEYIYKGRRWHYRTFFAGYKHLIGTPEVTVVKGSSKYRYLMPLDREIAKRVESMTKPYPKKDASEAQGVGAIDNPVDRGRCDSDPDAFKDAPK